MYTCHLSGPCYVIDLHVARALNHKCCLDLSAKLEIYSKIVEVLNTEN